MVLLQRQLYFSEDPEGVQHFPGGGGGGGGGPDPYPYSGSAHENLHDALIADLHCTASRPSDERTSLTCIM